MVASAAPGHLAIGQELKRGVGVVDHTATGEVFEQPGGPTETLRGDHDRRRRFLVGAGREQERRGQKCRANISLTVRCQSSNWSWPATRTGIGESDEPPLPSWP